MKILELTMNSSNIKAQKHFYKDVLGFELVDDQTNSFSINVGATRLTFVEAEVAYKYHYCFLIPSNQLPQATDWLKKRTSLVKIEGDRVTQFFDTWNAESIYFFDGNGNIAEFIVRYDLKNANEEAFGVDQILNVNEMGMPSNDIETVFEILNKETSIPFYKGNLDRFGTAGNEEGVFLLVNNLVKDTWFPTQLKTDEADFKIKVEVMGQQYRVNYEAGIISFL